jgi:2-hydroxy-3-keto-5-methylthiopentenyl-1-phosphate phosphatase
MQGRFHLMDVTYRRSEEMSGKHYLLVSDFDQTLSFNDSGDVLSEMLGITSFAGKVAGLRQLNLVQSGAELSYLLLHDPEFRRVRQPDLIEVGRRIRLKRNIPLLTSFLERGIDGDRFDLYIVSAAPEDVVHSALEGIIPRERIVATRFVYDAQSGEIASIVRVPAGYGKVAAVDELRARLEVPGERIVYVGDGSSDIHVMLHVTRGEGLTIAASETRHIASIAHRTVMSDDAMSVLIPILEEIGGYDRRRIRALFEEQGIVIQEWDRVRTDWLTIRDGDRRAPALA